MENMILKGKTEKKKIWTYYFNFNYRKTNFKKAEDELKTFGFRNFKKDQGVYDMEARISLEEAFNASKFATDLLTKFRFIKEIEVREHV
jgi:hypothetical protein